MESLSYFLNFAAFCVIAVGMGIGVSWLAAGELSWRWSIGLGRAIGIITVLCFALAIGKANVIACEGVPFLLGIVVSALVWPKAPEG